MGAFFAGPTGIIAAGALIGVLAALLQYAGNPANMGICVACFLRDIAGSLGLHQAAVVQYMRPEIPAFILGALGSAVVAKEFRPRAGSAPAVRYFLGMAAMTGALVFLGCPWRALLRLAGGDGNAIFGVAGLAFGIFWGTRYFKVGYSLGRSQPQVPVAGIMLALAAAGLLLVRMLLTDPVTGAGALFASAKGPGASHAPLYVSIAAGLVIGVLAQRSRFCTMGALRDLMLFGQTHLFFGVVAFTGAALVVNLALGQFHPGFESQPIAHTNSLWNFLGMVASGLAFALAGGCPGRQLILAGEGDGDAAMFALGMLTAAGLAHTMGWASSPAGIGPHGMAATIGAILLCAAVGAANMRKA